MLPNDARIYQILFLTCFLILGIAARDWTLHLSMIGVAIATCITTQWIAFTLTPYLSIDWRAGWLALKFWIQPLYLPTRQAADLRTSLPTYSVSPIEFDTSDPPTAAPALPTNRSNGTRTFQSTLPSALITALGLSLLLRTDDYSTMALASGAAILSKFFLRAQQKHWFNPANFGIIAALTFTQDAWVSPGQWGEDGWYALLFLGAGGLVLKRVGRWDTTAAFLISYAGLEAIRNVALGWTWDVWWHRLMSGSLLLFALFMITDPRTIPDARLGRLIWAIAIAVVTFILRNQYFLPTAPFWALFALAPFSLLLDRLFPASRFSWEATPPVVPTSPPG
jgi:Na+-transporting NADH:ubiquinone oxidoreductase subunit NqrB